MRTWRWAVITDETVRVCNMPPPFPGDPAPDGFQSWDEHRVVVRSHHLTRRRAERVAIEYRRRLWDTGQVSLAGCVEVWERPHVEIDALPDGVFVRLC